MSEANSEPFFTPPVNKRSEAFSPPLRAGIALLAPALISILVSVLTSNLLSPAPPDSRTATAVILGSAGLTSWLIGIAWYGIPGLGIRLKRPLFASIGFAVMGWVTYLIFHFFWVELEGFGPAGSTQAFIYLLLFEAFAVQIWTFGLFFRALSDWRGPLTATIISGLLFGLIAFLFFRESFFSNITSLIFFLMWGIFYGIIRLRTGSLLGTVIIQAMQSFTAWVVMVPVQIPPHPAAMHIIYFLTSLAFLIFIWRLWPKEVSDYRV
ncbi:MAG: hypothetical protein CSA11_05090 [Chloroflexi bacterium]|nr:MAG: hypothetical protein CSB13_12100 [Chloroflexota bacterium]PIE81151.1 MAG: hypothetical protein CSA11_05090 [Chloroflexota bacterium]